MSKVKVYLQKNLKRTDTNNQPYFYLRLIPEQEGGDWVNLGALWKSKSGKGYSGTLEEGITVSIPESTLSDEDKKTIKKVREGSTKNKSSDPLEDEFNETEVD